MNESYKDWTLPLIENENLFTSGNQELNSLLLTGINGEMTILNSKARSFLSQDFAFDPPVTAKELKIKNTVSNK